MDKFVIARGDRSGVFFGELDSQKGKEVKLKNVRKLYYWSGACAVEQLALDGVKNIDGCKFTVIVAEMTITDAIQIIPCTKKAIKNIQGVKPWKV